MSDQTPINEPQPNTDSQPDNNQPQGDWRDQRRRERELRHQRRWSRRGDAWIGGIILILLGVIFLLQNAGLLSFQNWWALFILIPAFTAFTTAWTRYQDSGRVDASVRGSVLVGFVLTMVAAAFLFNFTGAIFWPALLILAGIGVLVNAMWR